MLSPGRRSETEPRLAEARSDTPSLMYPAATSLVASSFAAPRVTPRVPRTGDGLDQLSVRSNTATVPPSASLPYCADAGPRTSSMRSTSAAGSQRHVLARTITPRRRVVANAVDQIHVALTGEAAQHRRALRRGGLLRHDAGFFLERLRHDGEGTRFERRPIDQRRRLRHRRRVLARAAGRRHDDLLREGPHRETKIERGRAWRVRSATSSTVVKPSRDADAAASQRQLVEAIGTGRIRLHGDRSLGRRTLLSPSHRSALRHLNQ